MDDELRRRMETALSIRQLDLYQVSKDAGLNSNYLWESFNRHKGSLEGYFRIADTIGLSFSWLLHGDGEPFRSPDSPHPIDPRSITVAFEVLLERAGLDRVTAHDAALTILEIIEHQPGESSAANKPSRIRSEILGVLRVYAPRPK